MQIIKNYLEIILAFIVFASILIFKYDFYFVLALILELMVIIEVMQMLFVFFKNRE